MSATAERLLVTRRGEPLLRLRGISKRAGAGQAPAGVDLEVPAGQVTGLVGDNGAGKSVLIKLIAGIHSLDSGEFRWQGRPVRRPRTRTPRRVGRRHDGAFGAQDACRARRVDGAFGAPARRTAVRRAAPGSRFMDEPAAARRTRPATSTRQHTSSS
ncbi:ATP-binding cassette domain-containing protein [Amycolatopsis sp. NPDC049253]|uniref:ATP-binding cassette domain-containing protein n=1 Tax=Amycolatopsis sp. NPDC049253 TaxID=3155274 RepID=UPI003435ED59